MPTLGSELPNAIPSIVTDPGGSESRLSILLAGAGGSVLRKSVASQRRPAGAWPAGPSVLLQELSCRRRIKEFDKWKTAKSADAE